jgi:hypothetical protein
MGSLRELTDENGRTHEPSLRELTADLDGIRQIIDERDRRYGVQFADAKEAVQSALIAQKELTSQAFLASKEAINKAESAGNVNDTKNNEFRAQLKDQAATFPTRIEVETRINANTARIDDFKKDFEKYKDQQAIEIRSLRESRAGADATKSQIVENTRRSEWSTALIISVVFGVFSTVGVILGAVYLVVAKATGH